MNFIEHAKFYLANKYYKITCIKQVSLRLWESVIYIIVLNNYLYRKNVTIRNEIKENKISIYNRYTLSKAL